MRDLKWLHIFTGRCWTDIRANSTHICTLLIRKCDTFCGHRGNTRMGERHSESKHSFSKLTLGIQTPESKMAAIKPINLAVALEPTSGPVVLEDHCRRVEVGGLGWTDTLMFPSVRSLSKTHTQPRPRSARAWCQLVVLCCFSFVINNNRPPGHFQHVATVPCLCVCVCMCTCSKALMIPQASQAEL